MVGLRDWPAGLTDEFDDVPADELTLPPAPRVHRGRCLPHPQPEGWPGHERFDAGRLQSRMEARRRPARAQRAAACCTAIRRSGRRWRRS